jgi:hypothetical protein
MAGDPDGVEIWKGAMKCCALPGGIGQGIRIQAEQFRAQAGTRESDYLQGVLDGLMLPRPERKD